MNSDLLSAKALGLLFYITSTDTRISAENLATIFGEGEKAIGSGVKELRAKLLIELKHEVVNGNVIKFSVITAKGRELIADLIRIPAPSSPYIFTDSRNRQNGDIDTSNEQLSKLILNIYKYKPNTFKEDEKYLESEINTKESHESSCPNCVREVTPLEQRLAAERVKQSAYDARKLEKHRVAIEKRQGKPTATWSISDVCMEIADRAANIWHLPPWRLSDSRLIAAFTQLRRNWRTNGEIEVHALDFFLRRINAKEYHSVDDLWMSFVYQFPEILPKVKVKYPTAEEFALQKEAYEITQRKLNELIEMQKSSPSREELQAKDDEINRIRRHLHHFQVMLDESSKDGQTQIAERYRKEVTRLKLEMAFFRNDTKEIQMLENQLDELNEVEDIPDGEFLI